MENRPRDPRWGAGREPQQPATRQSPPCRGGMGHCPCDMHLSGRAAEGGPALAWSRAARGRRELRVPAAGAEASLSSAVSPQLILGCHEVLTLCSRRSASPWGVTGDGEPTRGETRSRSRGGASRAGGQQKSSARGSGPRSEDQRPGAQPPAFSGARGSAKQGDLRAAPSFCSHRRETDHFYFDRKGIGDPGIVGILLFACTCLCLALSAFRHLSDTVLGSGFQSHRKKTQCLSKLSLWLVLSTMATATTGSATIQQSLV